MFSSSGQKLEEIKVVGGTENTCGISYSDFNAVVGKGEDGKITASIEIGKSIKAPVKIGDSVGKVIYKRGDTIVGETDILATESISKIRFSDVLARFFAKILIK